MTDEERTGRVNEAAEEFAEAIVAAYRTVAGRTAAAQELNTRLALTFYERVVDNLRTQADANRAVGEELIEQQRRQREASEVLAHQSLDAYMDFLGSMFALPRRPTREGSGPGVGSGEGEDAAREDAVHHPLSTWVGASAEAQDVRPSEHEPPGAAPPADDDWAPEGALTPQRETPSDDMGPRRAP